MGNETFDLSTGVGRPPNPVDYITKKTACSAASAGTPHPVWTSFLDRITDGDAELQGFLQRYMGYCCTGLTTEHKFVFAYGTGANGKGDLHQHLRGHPRRLRHRCRCRHLHRQQHRTTPYRPRQAARLPTGRRPGDREGPEMGRGQDQDA